MKYDIEHMVDLGLAFIVHQSPTPEDRISKASLLAAVGLAAADVETFADYRDYELAVLGVVEGVRRRCMEDMGRFLKTESRREGDRPAGFVLLSQGESAPAVVNDATHKADLKLYNGYRFLQTQATSGMDNAQINAAREARAHLGSIRRLLSEAKK